MTCAGCDVSSDSDRGAAIAGDLARVAMTSPEGAIPSSNSETLPLLLALSPLPLPDAPPLLPCAGTRLSTPAATRTSPSASRANAPRAETTSRPPSAAAQPARARPPQSAQRRPQSRPYRDLDDDRGGCDAVGAPADPPLLPSPPHAEPAARPPHSESTANVPLRARRARAPGQPFAGACALYPTRLLTSRIVSPSPLYSWNLSLSSCSMYTTAHILLPS